MLHPSVFRSAFIVSVLPLLAAAQAPAAADDPVVVVLDGKEWRKNELEAAVRALPPDVARNFFANKEAFLKQYALVTRLAQMAEKEGVPEKEPHRTRLAYNRMIYLAQAQTELAALKISVNPEEQEKYFAEHKDDFARAHVKVIYLSFNDNPLPSGDPKAKRPRTSAEAEKLARDLVAKARAGADFSELARKYSDDEETRAKGGDYTPLKPNDTNLPPQIRTAIFSLRPGQVSDPVRQTGGFWIFRLTEFVTPSLEDVRSEVYSAVREAKFREWIEGIQKSVQLEVRDPQYMGTGSPKQ
ncbi:MAG: peptidylprolyl isomerase [Acidobacteriota bacterium]